jgi:nucleotide-binding universal stress UspA family protein
VSATAYGDLAPMVVGRHEMVEAVQTRLDKLADVSGRAVYGPSGPELAVFSGGVDLIVVGTRGHGPAHRLLYGSTSHFLERHARCSLLVVPRSTGEHRRDGNGAMATAR